MTLNTQHSGENEPQFIIPTLAMPDEQFYIDILKGLTETPKSLPSKYFYNANGDKLFQQIMDCPEYYLTDCEFEIFANQTKELSSVIVNQGEKFDLIDLGAGDCKKTFHLLSHLTEKDVDFTFIPIDISESAIQGLNDDLSVKLPNLQINALCGEYMPMLYKALSYSYRRKIIMCLGGNIGNMTINETEDFYNRLRDLLRPGDMVITGFDLKKNPRVIMAAYDDKGGITRKFNLNLLSRINEELDADFELDSFEHYCSYDPESGSCKSYLVALKDMVITIQDELISFKKNEYIWMEISQKYDLDELDKLARLTRFTPAHYFFDNQQWFTDAVWIAE